MIGQSYGLLYVFHLCIVHSVRVSVRGKMNMMFKKEFAFLYLISTTSKGQVKNTLSSITHAQYQLLQTGAKHLLSGDFKLNPFEFNLLKRSNSFFKRLVATRFIPGKQLMRYSSVINLLAAIMIRNYESGSESCPDSESGIRKESPNRKRGETSCRRPRAESLTSGRKRFKRNDLKIQPASTGTSSDTSEGAQEEKEGHDGKGRPWLTSSDSSSSSSSQEEEEEEEEEKQPNGNEGQGQRAFASVSKDK